MKLIVKPIITAGIERGGEDLELGLTVEIDGDTPPTNLNGLSVIFDLDDREGYDFEDNNGNVSIQTDHYEFEWSGNADDVLNLEVGYKGPPVRDHLLDKAAWTFSHKPGEDPRIKYSEQIYIEGNAE